MTWESVVLFVVGGEIALTLAGLVSLATYALMSRMTARSRFETQNHFDERIDAAVAALRATTRIQQ